MSFCLLDRFPVELIHQIFAYLSAHEIVYAFSGTTEYLNGIVATYDRYVVAFHAITKCQFDMTCRCLRPEQILSLTFSDDDEASKQSEIFFSYFNIEQFTHLRSFNMESINSDTCNKLTQLHQLQQLTTISLSHVFQRVCPEFSTSIQKLLPQLNQLAVYNVYCLLNDPLPNLHHLALRYCDCRHLVTILTLMPNLRTFDVILTCGVRSHWPIELPLLLYLKKFTLRTEGEYLTLSQVEKFLSKTPNLKHFELETEGLKELFDGERWEPIVSGLSRFDFRIHCSDTSNNIFEREHVLQSFRSLFWLEQKRWFVAYYTPNAREIFTVPRFLSTIGNYPSVNWPPQCTLPDFPFAKHITHLQCSALYPLIADQFPNITSLTIHTNRTLDGQTLVQVIEQMKFLYSISIVDLSIVNHIPINVVFEKIRSLSVQEFSTSDSDQTIHDLDRVCFTFPRLERLNMKLLSHIHLFRLIDQLKYLSIAKFELHQSSSESPTMQRNWLINNCRRFQTTDNFTFRYVNDTIYLWMATENANNLGALTLTDTEPLSTWYSRLSCVLQ
ncbi:unnamed protein product [Adineta ricciae]|uniref:F-box domain-containing protein n=1 Tax=Adineta ricciae TaxID=249248 RepID=A0A815J7F7_ADIRI|nr:unnamed protein product [Adineta ricciae]CAF1376764.1 unnamed protein product [Adineta ricciae]